MHQARITSESPTSLHTTPLHVSTPAGHTGTSSSNLDCNWPQSHRQLHAVPLGPWPQPDISQHRQGAAKTCIISHSMGHYLYTTTCTKPLLTVPLWGTALAVPRGWAGPTHLVLWLPGPTLQSLLCNRLSKALQAGRWTTNLVT